MAEEFYFQDKIENQKNIELQNNMMELQRSNEEHSRSFRKSIEESSKKHDLWMEEMRRLIGWPTTETPETRRIRELSKDHDRWMEEMCRLLGLPKPESTQTRRTISFAEGCENNGKLVELHSQKSGAERSSLQAGSQTRLDTETSRYPGVTESHTNWSPLTAAGHGKEANHYYMPTRCSSVKFPRFDYEDIRGWVYNAEQFFDINETPAYAKVKIAAIHMEGRALQWHRMYMQGRLIREIPSWEEYVRALKDRFDTFNFEDLRSELMSLKQTGNVKEYSDRFGMLLNCFSLNDSFALSCFLGGLRTEISSTVRMFKPKTLLEAISLAKLQERALMLNPQIHVTENCEVLEASAENEKSNVCEVVAENFELKMLDGMSEESTGESVALQLSEDETELQVLDQLPQRSELKVFDHMMEKKLKCRGVENQGNDDDWKIKRCCDSTCEEKVMENTKQEEFVEIFEKGTEDRMAENLRIGNYQIVSLDDYMNLDNFEIIVEIEIVKRLCEIPLSNDLKKEGVCFIVIDIALLLVLLSKARSKSEVRHHIWCKWSILQRPPPEPPPQQSLPMIPVELTRGEQLTRSILKQKEESRVVPRSCWFQFIILEIYVQIHELRFGQISRIDELKRTRQATKNHLLVEFMEFYPKRPAEDHCMKIITSYQQGSGHLILQVVAKLWSLRTRTFSRGWICYEPKLSISNSKGKPHFFKCSDNSSLAIATLVFC